MMNASQTAVDVLVVDDESGFRQFLKEAIGMKGLTVDGAATLEEAIFLLQKNSYKIVLTDLHLPKLCGQEVVRMAKQAASTPYTIVVTGIGEVNTAVECMKLGAADVLLKPIDLATLYGIIDQGLERAEALAAKSVADLKQTKAKPSFLAVSQAMLGVQRLINHAAPTNSTILIRGESGTGKEVAARAIHQQSQRANRPFVALNCAAVPEHLLEDELFGHVRGAFTGADKPRTGRFEQAHQGTLFLDEIGSMSLPLQAKLLRVLQEREFERLGSATTVQCDVRIVAATNSDLETMVRRGEFREDLYYRLNVIPLVMPPLRERTEDILPLARHFLSKHAAQGNKRFSEDAAMKLIAYHWPGNVRELQNAVERALVYAGTRDAILAEDFAGALGNVNYAEQSRFMPPTLAASPVMVESMDEAEFEGEIDFENIVSEFERKLILQILQKTGGNKRRAAELLSLKRTTLGAKIRRLNLESYALPA